MDVKYDFSDVGSFIHEAENDTIRAMESIGEEAVNYAKEHGTYRNITGNLRRSNKYDADVSGLTIYNDADYAEAVEQRGYEVITIAALFAEKRLKEEFEQ